MKKIILTLSLLCASFSLMGDPTFRVVRKDEVNKTIKFFNDFAEEWNENHSDKVKFKVVDITLDDAENGWAVMKYEYHSI